VADLYLEKERDRRKAARTLAGGGVVVLPTDTLYGLSAAVSSDEAYRRILALKRCGENRRFLLLASSADMVERYVSSWGCTSREVLARLWPAPLTAILPAGQACPDWTGATVAFRVPDLEPLRELIDELGEPVVSTSANRSGESPLHRLEEIERVFGPHVDLLVASRREAQDLPSTIVDFTQQEPRLIRQGSYPWPPPAGADPR